VSDAVAARDVNSHPREMRCNKSVCAVAYIISDDFRSEQLQPIPEHIRSPIFVRPEVLDGGSDSNVMSQQNVIVVLTTWNECPTLAQMKHIDHK
jgi:hypothetical protein